MIQGHSDHGVLKGTDESTLVTDSSAPLMYHDPSDLGSLIPDLNQSREMHLWKISSRFRKLN